MLQKRAFDGVVNSLEWQGEDIQIGHVCIGTGVGSYQFYCDRPCVTNDLHGVGAFLLMCTELQVAENVCAMRCAKQMRCAQNVNELYFATALAALTIQQHLPYLARRIGTGIA